MSANEGAVGRSVGRSWLVVKDKVAAEAGEDETLDVMDSTINDARCHQASIGKFLK